VVKKLSVIGQQMRSRYEIGAAGFERGVSLLERRYTPLGRFSPGPFEGWSFLWQPALLGFFALCAIVAGASFTNSPFKLNMTNTWFFGEPAVGAGSMGSQTKLLLSIVLVYGGLVLLMRVWLRLSEVMKNHPGSPIKQLWKILALWSVPMIIAPPLFSRDVFSYAAQGEMTSYHLSPYILGPFSLGSSPYVAPVDPLWGNAPAPYGPLFLWIDGTITRITHHNHLATVVGLRLLEVAAVALMAYALPLLARAMGRSAGEAFVLGALNPLVLLTLIGGAHNDALMAAFLTLGIAKAMQKKPLWGFFFCACAAAIKAPAALGMVYVAWTCVSPYVSKRERLRPFLYAGAIGAFVLGVSTWMAGFGFGWVKNLLSNGTVRSWAAPATGVGMAITSVSHGLGVSVSETSILSVTRTLGLMLAVALCLWLLLNANRRGWVRSLGVSLLLLVVLGPVVQPWYLVWGIVLLATSYVGREHFWILAFSITAPFLGLPGGRALLDGLIHVNPLLTALVLALMAGALLLPMGRWTQWSWPEVESRQVADVS
jgi:hypothetical protein